MIPRWLQPWNEMQSRRLDVYRVGSMLFAFDGDRFVDLAVDTDERVRPVTDGAERRRRQKRETAARRRLLARGDAR